MNFLLRLVGSVVAVWLTVVVGRLFGVGLEWQGIGPAFIFVIVLALVNAFIRPIVKLFTLPITCLTLGLFAFVVNALLFWLTAWATHGLEVKTVWAALFGSVVLSLLSGIINSIIRHRPGSRGSRGS